MVRVIIDVDIGVAAGGGIRYVRAGQAAGYRGAAVGVAADVQAVGR